MRKITNFDYKRFGFSPKLARKLSMGYVNVPDIIATTWVNDGGIIVGFGLWGLPVNLFNHPLI